MFWPILPLNKTIIKICSYIFNEPIVLFIVAKMHIVEPIQGKENSFANQLLIPPSKHFYV
jgi:hypothetical protein